MSVYKASLILAAMGIMLSVSLAGGSCEPGAGSCEPGKGIFSYPGDIRISASSLNMFSIDMSILEDLIGQDQASYDKASHDLARYYSHARQYAAADKQSPSDRSSKLSSIRPARTPRFDLSIQDVSRLTLFLNLNGSIRADLDLYQSGEMIFGKGNLTSGNFTQEVGATGTLDHDRMALDLVTQEGNLYRLNLQGSGQSLSGEYEATSPGGRTWSGSVTSRPGH